MSQKVSANAKPVKGRLIVLVSDRFLYSLLERDLESDGYLILNTIPESRLPAPYYDLLITDDPGLSASGDLIQRVLFLRTLVIRQGENERVSGFGDDVVVIDPTNTHIPTMVGLLCNMNRLERQNRMLQQVFGRNVEGTGQNDPDSDPALKDRVEQFECGLIMQALKQCRGNQSRAADLLRTKKTTFYMKVRHYDIDVSTFS